MSRRLPKLPVLAFLEAAIKAGRYPEGKALGDSLCELLEECAATKPA